MCRVFVGANNERQANSALCSEHMNNDICTASPPAHRARINKFNLHAPLKSHAKSLSTSKHYIALSYISVIRFKNLLRYSQYSDVLKIREYRPKYFTHSFILSDERFHTRRVSLTNRIHKSWGMSKARIAIGHGDGAARRRARGRSRVRPIRTHEIVPRDLYLK